MPRRTDLETILVIGSGPIVIGQACEFDYSGTQACRALRAEGYRVVLVNSNPATIMTDPEFADATYLEPITPASVLSVIGRERPDALLATLGGQTALNVSLALAERGALEEWGVRLIGAGVEAIRRAEDRALFVRCMTEAGLPLPASGFARSVEQALEVGAGLGYPVMVRPSFVLGGGGTGLASGPEDLARVAAEALRASPAGEALVEESLAGWKEFELEVVRDGADRAIVVCSIENVDPMGVHTGDSVTVAPALTLTDRDYQRMRDAALACIRAVGVETGGSNVQFAVHPGDGRMVLIEMNPRVSRSSALASKATGFPIAKVAALLAVGYRLDEIPNDVTGQTLAAFEPAIDYVAVKVPRWAFEKFPEAGAALSTTMRSVGEVMALGGSFEEALGKAWRALEIPGMDLGSDRPTPPDTDLSIPTEDRLLRVEAALAAGRPVEEVAAESRIDAWFVDRIAIISEAAAALRGRSLGGLPEHALREAKRCGLSDRRVAALTGSSEAEVRTARLRLGIRPVYKTVDTCAGEFAARTPYHYSTYAEQTEIRPGPQPAVIVLGAGPNRIGQGIEFDYACVQAVTALRRAGFETVMVNSNPETVSTDYDTSDRLYLEPVTLEDVLEICEVERPAGVLVQFGGQTPLSLAAGPGRGGGAGPRAPTSTAWTSPRTGPGSPSWSGPSACSRRPHAVAASPRAAGAAARRVGYPIVVRPSYVLGGRAMAVVDDPAELDGFVRQPPAASPDHPVFLDHFLEGAIEVDCDAVCDGHEVLIGGVMEHIEEAGVHSGDSSCVIPPPTLTDDELEAIEACVDALARALGVVGAPERAARRPGRAGLRPGGEPPRLADPPVRVQGHRALAGELAARVMAGATLGDLRADGSIPERPTGHRDLAVRGREGPGLPLRPVPGRGRRARSRDALDRRGHRHRSPARRGAGQGEGGGGDGPPRRGARCSCRWRTGTSGPWPSPVRRLADLGFRCWPPGARRRSWAGGACGDHRPQAVRGHPQRGRPHRGGRGGPRDEHPVRAGAAVRRLRDPHGGDPGRGPVRDHGRRRARRPSRASRPLRGAAPAPVAPGVPCREAGGHGGADAGRGRIA